MILVSEKCKQVCSEGEKSHLSADLKRASSFLTVKLIIDPYLRIESKVTFDDMMY